MADALVRLHRDGGQSPWLDNLRRDWLVDGTLRDWLDRGVRGVTSNPSIFQKAIQGSDLYDDQFGQLISAGLDPEQAYWRMVSDDIIDACRTLAPVYESSGGHDGFVSVEVSPSLAHDTQRTTTAAFELATDIAQPNLMVKIPGTRAGLEAVSSVLAGGVSVNVTLLFSVERYRQVLDAHATGLERLRASGGDLSRVASVASFFVSRVDTEVDRRLVDAGGTATELCGTAAVANAQIAHEAFAEFTSSPRWEALASAGAQVQRPLWASTSTKNPDYPTTLYVDTLIGPDTVNTMPEATLEAFATEGTVARTVDADPDAARAAVARLSEAGIDLEEVADLLEDEGVAAFQKSFDELLAALAVKAGELTA